MPRISRAVAVGHPHHITQRGNYRQSVFETDDDRTLYLDWLQTYSMKYDLKIWAYCLMGNHVHFIAVPIKPDSMAKTFNTLHMRYSQHINSKHKTAGHLWQGRFYSCVLDERHLYAGMRYVENNPVRAGLVKSPEEYRWSSASSHIRQTANCILADDCPMTEAIKDWAAYLLDKEDDAVITAIRQHTKTGRPCGDEVFRAKIEETLGRRLESMGRGRPRKRE